MTDTPERTCDHLVLLVGSNPLPNYLTTLVLKPTSVQLLYTPETQSVKDCLEAVSVKRLPGLKIKETYIDNGADAQRVRDACQCIPDNAHLNYTGGTKIMAAHARMAFRDRGGRDNLASYLDERNSVLRFDDGYEIELSKQDFDLTLDDILSLHGIAKSPEAKQKPTIDEATTIAESVLKDDKACSSSGLWLDVWTGGKVLSLLKRQPEVGLNCKRENGRDFEIDVVCLRGHRLYVISCTAKKRLRDCKSKLFEVAMRARQLGGDLARSALVCLIYGKDANGAYIDQLRNDVADVWDAPNTPQVFGLDDLKEWVGAVGQPNTSSLENWLAS